MRRFLQVPQYSDQWEPKPFLWLVLLFQSHCKFRELKHRNIWGKISERKEMGLPREIITSGERRASRWQNSLLGQLLHLEERDGFSVAVLVKLGDLGRRLFGFGAVVFDFLVGHYQETTERVFAKCDCWSLRSTRILLIR